MIQSSDVFRVFQDHRGDAIVIPTGTSGRHWREFTTNERSGPQPGRRQWAIPPRRPWGWPSACPKKRWCWFDSEGSLLMNLGILANNRRQEAAELLPHSAG